MALFGLFVFSVMCALIKNENRWDESGTGNFTWICLILKSRIILKFTKDCAVLHFSVFTRFDYAFLFIFSAINLGALLYFLQFSWLPIPALPEDPFNLIWVFIRAFIILFLTSMTVKIHFIHFYLMYIFTFINLLQ